MTEPEQPERPQYLTHRASDADRERVAKVLHDAMAEGRIDVGELDERLQTVYAAKTLGELEPITADLPNSPVLQPGPAPAAPGSGTVANPTNKVVGGSPHATPMFAMLSGFERKGRWTVPRFQSAIAILGGGEMDLREAVFAEQECTIQVFALLGGVEITVPEDLTVRVEGIGILGGFNRGDGYEGDPDGPVLHVTGAAILGGVEIKRRPPRKPKKPKRLRGGELD